MQADTATPVTQRGAIPTNMVVYKGRKIPARIDPDARLAHVVEIMSASFATKEHHITLCLRDESDGLVTQANMPSKVINRDVLKLVASPTTEALAVVASLKAASHSISLSTSSPTLNSSSTNETLPLKLALFNLQKYVKEEDFTVEFMLKGGMKILVKLLERSTKDGLTGNSLAYALQGIRGILEYEASWNELSDITIDRIIQIVITGSSPNVLRPATAILRKFVISSPHLSSLPNYRKGKAKGKAKALVPGQHDGGRQKEEPEIAVGSFGFDRVYRRMTLVEEDREQTVGSEGIERVLSVVLKRLEGTGDLELVAQSLGFINASMRSGYQDNSELYPALVVILEHLHIRRHVSRLIPISLNNIVEPQILNFQARYTAVLHQKRIHPVRPAQNSDHDRMLNDIFVAGRLRGNGKEDDGNGGGSQKGHGHRRGNSQESWSGVRSWAGWKRLGFDVDGSGGVGGAMGGEEGALFRDVGQLGLECLHWFAMHDDNFHSIVMEQSAKYEDRRCPIGAASIECVKILCEHYKVSQAGHHAPPHFQLFLLNFPRLHHIVLRFFIRMWQESESRLTDFTRVSFLVRTQIRLSLESETSASKNWLQLESELLESDYTSIRDRQMESLEKEGGMMTKPAVLGLRERLYEDAYAVVTEQRIGCMLLGNWFNAAVTVVPGITSAVKAKTAKPSRFLRLSPNRRIIAWDEFASRDVTPSFDSLRERIDISNITDVRLQTSCAIGSRTPNIASKLSFSLMSDSELSLMDLDAIHAAQLAEWTDGIRALRGEVGMRSSESANYVHILTELALRVRLLDITGDGVELPDKISFGPAPQSVDFCFAK